MNERVLILIPTNAIKAYCLAKFISQLKAIVSYEKEFHNSDIGVLFSDDGRDDEHKGVLEKLGYEVIKVQKTMDAFKRGEKPSVVQCLANARNALRKEFCMRKEYTHALWLDSDIIPPISVVEKLSSEKDIMSGVYWQWRYKDSNGQKIEYLAPMLFKYRENEAQALGINEYMAELDVQELFPNRVIGDKNSDVKIVAFGTGCWMASRKMMDDERWTFRYNPDKPNTTEDMWFSMDMTSLGYEIYANTEICCRHYMMPWSSNER